MRSVFLIQHTPTQTWFEGGRGRHFKKSIDEAALYYQRANADKMIRDLTRNALKHGVKEFLDIEGKKYQSVEINDHTPDELKVVEFKLVLATEDGEVL